MKLSQRITSFLMALFLALATIPATPLQALADATVEVRFYFLDNAFFVWNQTNDSFDYSYYYRYSNKLAGVELPTAPASITKDGSTASVSVTNDGSGTLSGTSYVSYSGDPSGITNVKASLDSANLNCVPTFLSSTNYAYLSNHTLNASDYYFVGWYASDAYKNSIRTFITSNETVTADQVRSFISSEKHSSDYPVALYPIYLPKSTTSTISLGYNSGYNEIEGEYTESTLVTFNAQTNAIESAKKQRIAINWHDPAGNNTGRATVTETPIDLTGATDDTVVVDLEEDDYYHEEQWSVELRDMSKDFYAGDWTTSQENGFWQYLAAPGSSGGSAGAGTSTTTTTTSGYKMTYASTTSTTAPQFGSRVLTKGEIESFLKATFRPGQSAYESTNYYSEHSTRSLTTSNKLKLVFAPDTSATANTKTYEYEGSKVAAGTSDMSELPTLADLQADAEIGAAYATPTDMKFDGWFVSDKPNETAPASAAAATAANKQVVSDSNIVSTFDSKLKAEPDSTYYLSPIWLDQSLGWRSEGGHDKYYEGTKEAPVAATGLKAIGGSTYYFNASGELQVGLQTIAGEQYYFDPDRGDGPSGSGAMATDALRTISGKTYYFAADGKMAKNTQVVHAKKRYYAGADGAFVSGWQGAGDARRYYVASENGEMATSRLLEIESDGTYLFKSDGSYVKDRIALYDYPTYYYFDADGRMASGWQTYDGKTFYLHPDTGKMAISEKVEIGSDTYYFNYWGNYVTDKVIAFDDGDRYFDADGKMVKNTKVTIEGIEYDALSNGVLSYPFASLMSGFTIGRNNNSYVHTNRSGGGFQGKATYAISNNYFNRLTSRLSASDRSHIQWKMNNKSWGGSCYGISITMGLTFEGKLPFKDMTRSSASSYYFMPRPATDAKQMDTVNYYQISQFAYDYAWYNMADTQTGRYMYAVRNYMGSGSLYSFLSNLVNNPTREPVRVMCYAIPGWCHAVLVTGVSWSAAQGKYDVQVYDMNSVGYRGGSTGGFSHMYVSPDFKSFVFTDGVGNRATEKNYDHLTIANVSKYASVIPLPTGLTVASLTDQSVMEEAGALKTAADEVPDVVSAQATEETDEYDATPKKHVRLTIPYSEEYTITNAEGRKLTYQNEEYDGDMVIYAINPLPSDDESLIEIETDESTFTVTVADTELEFTVADDTGFLALNAKGADSATFDVASGKIDITGSHVRFNAGVLTQAQAAGDLVGISGNSTGNVSIEREGRAGLSVSSSDTLSDVKATRYDGALTNTIDVATNGKEAEVNAEIDFVDSNAKATDVTVDDPSETGPTTPDTPDTQLDPAQLYPEDRDYWVDKGDGTTEGAHWFVYRAGKLRTDCWVWLAGDWYYLGSDGEMLVGKQHLDFLGEGGWYFFNPDHDGAYGKMREGWFCDGGSWFYMFRESDHKVAGMVATGWQLIDGTWYYFKDTGEMVTGWLWYAGAWYYLADDGHMITNGWALDGGKWYWFNQDGTLVKNAWVWDGAWWWVDGDGVASV